MRAVLLCKIKKRGSGRSMKRVACRKDGDVVLVFVLKIFFGDQNSNTLNKLAQHKYKGVER